MQQEEFSFLDRHFAGFMLKLAKNDSPELYLASGLLCRQTDQGNVCLDLPSYAGRSFSWSLGDRERTLTLPRLPEWIDALKRCSVVGKPGQRKPLILEETGGQARLYLLRYWNYEHDLAGYIKSSLGRPVGEIDRTLLEQGLNRLFPTGSGETDWQREAARTALTRKFSVVSGGPGTGKTSTVIKIMVLLLEQAEGGGSDLALAAPTGKAATRLKESIVDAKKRLGSQCSQEILDRIPEETFTLHRLLRNIKNSPYFRFNKDRPLPYQCVIVDEASMVDLALMCKLVEALTPDTRLILLGDNNQLSSVEAGSVLGDICAALDPEGSSGGADPGGAVVNLKKSYRFKQEEGIGKLSSLVNGGQGRKSLDLLLERGSPEIGWTPLPEPGELKRYLRSQVLPIYSRYFQAESAQEAFRIFGSFAVLCALRNGPYGATNINYLLERLLIEEGLVKPDTRWYPGRPIMVTRNDYNLQLFNGDIGMIHTDDLDDNRLKAHFETSGGELRKVVPSWLSEHETAFAMTVHKSQGSEFDKVVLVLPDRDSPVLTRELIYTGITRTKEEVEIWGEDRVFVKAVGKKIERSSGLKDALSVD
ncbi:MAG: exodeoxyribonuclease V subunit alpha [Proteobacteria bacterium]|nr:exodeoxyribonuclease V subunit alpha [Pseudomonadota bacterium]